MACISYPIVFCVSPTSSFTNLQGKSMGSTIGMFLTNTTPHAAAVTAKTVQKMHFLMFQNSKSWATNVKLGHLYKPKKPLASPYTSPNSSKISNPFQPALIAVGLTLHKTFIIERSPNIGLSFVLYLQSIRIPWIPSLQDLGRHPTRWTFGFHHVTDLET